LSRTAIRDCYFEDLTEEDKYCGRSISNYLNQVAVKMEELGRDNCSNTIKLLSNVSSMYLDANIINAPFKPAYIDYINNRRTFDLEDISKAHIDLFEEIINEVKNKFLYARLADLLWLLKTPRNPSYATKAIDAYISREINHDTWHKGARIEIERALQLCFQINDQERKNIIKEKLYKAHSAVCPESKFFSLWVADLMDRLKIDDDIRKDIGERLINIANIHKDNNDYMAAMPYFELAAKKFKQVSNIDKEVKCLISIAECHENEAETKVENNNLVANSFYEDALQAYRKIPKRHRAKYRVEQKLDEIQQKITSSGKAAIAEMAIIQIESSDISEMINLAINHVSGKSNSYLALLYLAGLSGVPNYSQITKNVKDSLNSSFFSNLFGGRHLSEDGRLIAKTPSLKIEKIVDNDVELESIERQIHQQFSNDMQSIVQGRILPALNQICFEHRFSKELLIEICKLSSLIPDDRSYLMGSALWFGFERDFSIAIHLICPQIENIVRTSLKEAGAITSSIDNSGIETENGLSAIMKLQEAKRLFGEDLCFEINAVFCNPLGFNARNQVAHGLLSDESASYSVGSIYAWWMTLRMIVGSISHKYESE
ncbi:DUF4209 domain-containing protein, partial [Acinetobacter johnsonii]|uniref:DUF4209 domain-containing protein n=1 Tax=Acinetobacter johnsonii TaxID=40214 RepID=UPI00309A6AC0